MSEETNLVPQAIVNALDLYEQYVRSEAKDKTILAQCVSEMANLGLNGTGHHFSALINKLTGHFGDNSAASLAVWDIKVHGTWGKYPEEVKKKILEMHDAISAAY